MSNRKRPTKKRSSFRGAHDAFVIETTSLEETRTVRYCAMRKTLHLTHQQLLLLLLTHPELRQLREQRVELKYQSAISELKSHDITDISLSAISELKSHDITDISLTWYDEESFKHQDETELPGQTVQDIRADRDVAASQWDADCWLLEASSDDYTDWEDEGEAEGDHSNPADDEV